MTSVGHTSHGRFYAGFTRSRMQPKNCIELGGASEILLENEISAEKAEPRSREKEKPNPAGIVQVPVQPHLKSN